MKICRFGVVMLHQVQLLIGSSASKRKVHFRVGWKIFAENIFSVKFDMFVQTNMFRKI